MQDHLMVSNYQDRGSPPQSSQPSIRSPWSLGSTPPTLMAPLESETVSAQPVRMTTDINCIPKEALLELGSLHCGIQKRFVHTRQCKRERVKKDSCSHTGWKERGKRFS